MFPIFALDFTPDQTALIGVLAVAGVLLGVLCLHLAMARAKDRRSFVKLGSQLNAIGVPFAGDFLIDLGTVSPIEAGQEIHRVMDDARYRPEAFMARLDKGLFDMLANKMKTPDGLAAVQKVVDAAQAVAVSQAAVVAPAAAAAVVAAQAATVAGPVADAMKALNDAIANATKA